MKNQKGITLMILVTTVVVMTIVLGTISYNSKSAIGMRSYYNMCADIELLNEKVALYYLEHRNDEDHDENFGLPIKEIENKSMSFAEIDADRNNLYQIDYDKLSNLTLTYVDDYYIDISDHTIYLYPGILVEGEPLFTIPY